MQIRHKVVYSNCIFRLSWIETQIHRGDGEEPTRYCLPSNVAFTPWPYRFETNLTGHCNILGIGIFHDCSAILCSDFDSINLRFKNSDSVPCEAILWSLSLQSCQQSVSRFANANVLTFPNSSKYIEPLTKIPSFDNLLRPATIPNGVLNVKAHGHEITNRTKPR